jgi:hypothetical protein
MPSVGHRAMRIEALVLTSRPSLGVMRPNQVLEIDEMDLNGLQEARDLLRTGEAKLADAAPRVHRVDLSDDLGLMEK